MKQEMLPSAVIYKHILRAGFIVYCHKRQRHWMIAAPAGENTKQLLTCELPLKKVVLVEDRIRAIFEVQVTPRSI